MKRIIFLIIGILVLIAIVSLSLNYYVIYKYDNDIISEEEASKLEDIDCILVLGAGIKNGGPSPMLRDRLIVSSNLYNNGVSKKLIVSGDHSRDNYDEVVVMKNYLIDKLGIPSEDVYKDHFGIATYDSIYRAKEVYACKKIIIVTQEYHLYRSLYLADKIGLEAYGVSASLEKYSGQFMRDVRELLARNKDFVKGIILPKPSFEVEVLPASSNGDDTNDR